MLLSAVVPCAAQRITTSEHVVSLKPTSTTHQVVGYFPQWGVYNRRYVPKDLITRGAVDTLTTLN